MDQVAVKSELSLNYGADGLSEGRYILGTEGKEHSSSSQFTALPANDGTIVLRNRDV